MNTGTNQNIYSKIVRLHFYFYLIFLFFPTIAFSQAQQVQPTQITDFVLYGIEGVFIGSSNTINQGSIGSDVLVQSTGNAVITGNIYSQGRVILANGNQVGGRIGAANLDKDPGTILNVGSSANLGGNIDVNGNIFIGGGTVS